MIMTVMMMLLPVLVDEGVEGHPVPPAGREVVDVDIGIPEEETTTEYKKSLKAALSPRVDV